MSREDLLNVKSVGKAFRILECFKNISSPERDLSLMDIVNMTGYDKSAAQRFTHTLQAVGYLSKNVNTKRYSLSIKALELAFNFLQNNSFVEMANPHLIDLCRVTGQRVSLSLFDDTSIVYVMRHHNKPDYYFSSLVGRRIPAFCTAGGRGILAKLDKTEALAILDRSELKPYTTRTITDKPTLLKEMAKTAKKGYGLSVEEVTYGEMGLGAAVTDKTGYPVAALHLTGSLADHSPEEFEERYATLMLETVQRISGR